MRWTIVVVVGLQTCRASFWVNAWPLWTALSTSIADYINRIVNLNMDLRHWNNCWGTSILEFYWPPCPISSMRPSFENWLSFTVSSIVSMSNALTQMNFPFISPWFNLCQSLWSSRSSLKAEFGNARLNNWASKKVKSLSLSLASCLRRTWRSLSWLTQLKASLEWARLQFFFTSNPLLK